VAGDFQEQFTVEAGVRSGLQDALVAIQLDGVPQPAQLPP
jgi:hypothetical protein